MNKMFKVLNTTFITKRNECKNLRNRKKFNKCQ